MSFEGLLVNAQRPWRVLRKRDYAGIASHGRVAGWGPVPGSPSERTIGADNFALVSEDELACLHTTSGATLRSGGLHLRLCGGFGDHIVTSKAPAESSKEGHVAWDECG